MADNNKVIKEFELYIRDFHPSCTSEGVELDMLKEVLNLLKEKQPRVLTFREAIQIEDEVCIEVNHPETNRNYCRWCDICYDGNITLAMYTTHGIQIISEESYNKRWRVWSDRPTDEQRKAVLWETN